MSEILSYGSLSNSASLGQRIPCLVYESLEEADVGALGIDCDHPDDTYAEAVEKVRLYREMRREFREHRPSGFDSDPTGKVLENSVDLLRDNLGVSEDLAESAVENIWSEEEPDLDEDYIGSASSSRRRSVGAYATEKWMDENGVEIESTAAGITPAYCLDGKSGSMLGAIKSSERHEVALITGLSEESVESIEDDERSASEDGGYYTMKQVPISSEDNIIDFLAVEGGRYRRLENVDSEHVDAYLAVTPEGAEQTDSVTTFLANPENPLVNTSPGPRNGEYHDTVTTGFDLMDAEFNPLVPPIPGASGGCIREEFNTLEQNERASRGLEMVLQD